MKQFKCRASKKGLLLKNDRSGKAMGETAKSYIKEWYVSELTGKQKEIKSKYSKKDMENLVDQASASIRSMGGGHELSEIKVNGVPFNKLPLEEQTLIILQMFNVKEV